MATSTASSKRTSRCAAARPTEAHLGLAPRPSCPCCDVLLHVGGRSKSRASQPNSRPAAFSCGSTCLLLRATEQTELDEGWAAWCAVDMQDR